MIKIWQPHYLKWLLLTVLGIFLAGSFYLWLILFSSLGYEIPPESLALEPDQQHSLFVYGTLRNPLIRYLVIGRSVAYSPATASGYRRQGLNLEAAEDSEVRGKLLTVDSDELRRLDRYERLGVRYERVRLTLEEGQQAWVYQRLEPD